jgi:hypothetical protein
MQLCSHACSDLLSVVGCLVFPFASVPKLCFHISSKASPPTAGQSSQHYRNYSMVANSPMSPKTTATTVSQGRSPSQSCFKWFCLQILEQCFFSRNPSTNNFFHLLNALTLPCPILLAHCFKENVFGFRLSGVEPQYCPSLTNYHSHNLHHIHLRTSPVMEASLQCMQHLVSAVPQAAGIDLLADQWEVSQVCRKEVQVEE